MPNEIRTYGKQIQRRGQSVPSEERMIIHYYKDARAVGKDHPCGVQWDLIHSTKRRDVVTCKECREKLGKRD